MQSFDYLTRASEMLKGKLTREELVEILDELEYLYEAFDPKIQDLVAQLVDQCYQRLAQL